MMCSIMRLFLFITGNLWDRLKSFLTRARVTPLGLDDTAESGFR
jgi:hypothetical protein